MTGLEPSLEPSAPFFAFDMGIFEAGKHAVMSLVDVDPTAFDFDWLLLESSLTTGLEKKKRGSLDLKGRWLDLPPEEASLSFILHFSGIYMIFGVLHDDLLHFFEYWCQTAFITLSILNHSG